MATETVINRPAPFVEDIGKRLAEQTLALHRPRRHEVPAYQENIWGLFY